MEKDTRQTLPEAPASVTARVVSDKGFHILFTLRDTTISGLIAKFDEFQRVVLTKGWQPEQKEVKDSPARTKAVGNSTILSNLECSVCGERAVEKKGVNKQGKAYHGIFCSTGDKTHTQWVE